MGPNERIAQIVSSCRAAGLPGLASGALTRYLTGLRTLEWTSRYLPADAPWLDAVATALATCVAGGDERDEPALDTRLRALCAYMPARATSADKLVAVYARTGADARWGELHATLSARGIAAPMLYQSYLRTGVPLVRDGALTALGRVIAEGARGHRDAVRGAFDRASDVVRLLLAAPSPDYELAQAVALTAREMDLGVCVAVLLEADARRFVPFAVAVAGPDSVGDEIDRATALEAVARHDLPLALDLAATILRDEPVASPSWRIAEPHATALRVAYTADPARFAGAMADALRSRHYGFASAAVEVLVEHGAADARATLEWCVAEGRAAVAAAAARALLASEPDEAQARARATALCAHPMASVRAAAAQWLATHPATLRDQAA